jgi:hypothetical protein
MAAVGLGKAGIDRPTHQTDFIVVHEDDQPRSPGVVRGTGIVLAQYLRAFAEQRCSVRHTDQVTDHLRVKASRQLQARTHSRIVKNSRRSTHSASQPSSEATPGTRCPHSPASPPPNTTFST